MAPRASFVPPSASAGAFPTFTVNRYRSPSTTGSTQAPRSSLRESTKVLTRGTSAWAKAGLGLFTVRAQSQAMTVSSFPS